MSEILTDPSNLARGLERVIESERGPSSGEYEASWLGRISEIDAKQERLLDLRLDGNITPEQFRAQERPARRGPRRRLSSKPPVRASLASWSCASVLERIAARFALALYPAVAVPRASSVLPRRLGEGAASMDGLCRDGVSCRLPTLALAGGDHVSPVLAARSPPRASASSLP